MRIRPWAWFSLIFLLAGCAGTGTTSESGSEAGEPSFVRQVYPFDVRDASGEPYEHPFLGGLDVPRPQFVDIDADGDPDLFLQERTGRVMFFENTGTATEPRFVWRTDRFRDLQVGEWYRFADMDEDGDYDLLAEQPYSYVRYYRNGGSPEQPAFTVAADTLRDTDGRPLFSDRQNIPNVTDIDCDGQRDLFIGRLDGTIMRYEETGTAPSDAPRFRLVTERFEGIEIVSQVAQPGGAAPNLPQPGTNPGGPGGGNGSSAGDPYSPSLHGANTMIFADVDDDGDEDLLWGDFFEPSLLLIENTGSCQTPVLRNDPKPFPLPDPVNTSGYNAPTMADVDGDGDLDLFVGVLGGAFDPSRTAQDNLYFYEQTEPGRYALRTRRFLDGIDVGSESFPALADLDGDGDPDLLLANKLAAGGGQTAQLFLFENQGTPTQPAYAMTDTLDLEPSYHYAPALGDLDGDGDLDLLVGTWNDGVALYRNEGTAEAPGFTAEDLSFIQLTRGSHSTPALVDIDGDGDLDLFVGETSGTINFYRNEGTPQQPDFVLVSDEYDGIDVGRRSVPVFLDLDEDGDYDLLIGSEADGVVVYRNEGAPQRPDFVHDGTLPLDAPELATPAFADVDGDGDPDLFTGSRAGGLLYFEQQRAP